MGKNKPSRVTRASILQPPDWWIAFKTEARRRSISLSEFVGVSARAFLPPGVAGKLSDRLPRHRPRGGISDEVADE